MGLAPFPRSGPRSWSGGCHDEMEENENSSAEARDMPASCPAAMVAIDRDVPGKTADKIWQAPIQTACPKLMASIFQVWILLPVTGPAASAVAFMASTIHITTPPISKELPMMWRLSRCLPMILVKRNAGIAVTTNAMVVSPSGWVCIAVATLTLGKRREKSSDPAAKYTGRQRMAPS